VILLRMIRLVQQSSRSGMMCMLIEEENH